MKRSRIPAVCIAIIFTATGLEAAPPEARPTLPLTVAFRDCVESIGVALVATEQVPAPSRPPASCSSGKVSR